MIGDITVFDFETSGLDPETERVIEMAAIRIRNGQVVGEFSTIVNQQEIAALPDRITEITGITTEMMRSGMDEQTAFKVLNRMMGDSLLVAHNATFDLAFLHYTLQRLAARTFQNHFIDTLTISRDRHYYPHKLVNMCEKLDIPLDGAHRALNDVHGCWGLLVKLNYDERVDSYRNKLGYLEKYGPPKWVPEYADSFPQTNKYEPKASNK